MRSGVWRALSPRCHAAAVARGGAAAAAASVRSREWRAAGCVTSLVRVHQRLGAAVALRVAPTLTQQRLSSTDTGTAAGAALAPTAAEFEKTFFEFSVAERLAAATAAKHELVHQATASDGTGEAPAGRSSPFIPMHTFVMTVSSLVRDDMFRRQLTAPQWVAQSTLLRLVDMRGEHVPLPEVRKLAGGEAVGEGDVERYDSSLHVRTAVPAEWLQMVGVCATVGASRTPTVEAAPPASLEDSATVGATAAAALSDSERHKIVVDAFMRALWKWDTAMRTRRVGNGGDVNTPAPSLPRYVPLTVLCTMILDEATRAAAAEGAEGEVAASTLTPAARYLLKRLRRETLEPVVMSMGAVVTVGYAGRTGEARQARYPPASSCPVWVVRGGARAPAVFVALRYTSDSLPPPFRHVQPRTVTATRENGYGGWSDPSVVPTKADVYEVLKYVPVNWGSFGCLTIPAELRRRHIRTSSSLQWFRRQPFYFELRDKSNRIEIRRSVVLHPEAHGMTREEAWEVLEFQMATGDANSLIPLGRDGTPLPPTESAFDRIVIKFLYRVCPSYFVPLSLLMQRYTKKNLTEPVLLSLARRFPQDFEILTLRYSDVPLVRRRAGADSSRWLANFTADLERHPEDVRGIIMLCNLMCTSWDRPEYIYVRLSPLEQQRIGGYATMQAILQRHPAVFRVGQNFVCRADPSDPLSERQPEPVPGKMDNSGILCEVNPYRSPHDLALVFHYVMPEGQPCTAAYLVDCASPAMRVTLPPRITTIVQLYPKMFACSETAPGVYSLRKVKPLTRGAAAPARLDGESAATGSAGTGSGDPDTGDEARIQMLEDEIADEDHMSRDEVAQAVHMLIPESGVEAPQLLLWTSMSVQRAANEHYGGVLRLVEAVPKLFRVVTTEHSKMIHRR
ncbi:hypothetical protein NESM_000819500 [Novymonas esmeraldas]|uniref:Uncharacterized protein n=1 Tax=Novymonas esmeraldas TaxID=1808958 RepID=A0AAW0F088_9TRYP